MTVRIRGFIDSLTLFVGLYITTLFSVCTAPSTGTTLLIIIPKLDAYAAGQASGYNINNRVQDGSRTGRGIFGSGGSGGGGGGGGGPGPGSGGGKKLGRVDDIRGPECKSCK